MTSKELLKICLDRNELEFLYKITKLSAELDSIGEAYSYCPIYSRELFGKEIEKLNDEFGYLQEIGLPLYELYLEQINIEYGTGST